MYSANLNFLNCFASQENNFNEALYEHRFKSTKPYESQESKTLNNFNQIAAQSQTKKKYNYFKLENIFNLDNQNFTEIYPYSLHYPGQSLAGNEKETHKNKKQRSQHFSLFNQKNKAEGKESGYHGRHINNLQIKAIPYTCSSSKYKSESLSNNLSPLLKTSIQNLKCHTNEPKLSYGQGSSLNFTECPLCLIGFDLNIIPNAIKRLRNCDHGFCGDCLYRYFEIEINDGRINLACPKCTEKVHPSDVTEVLLNDTSTTKLIHRDSKEEKNTTVKGEADAAKSTTPKIKATEAGPGTDLVRKYETFTLRRFLVSEPDARWCPAPDCGFAVIAAGCASCPMLKCERPGCNTYFCYHCKQEWHPNLTCDAAKTLRFRKNFCANFFIGTSAASGSAIINPIIGKASTSSSIVSSTDQGITITPAGLALDYLNFGGNFGNDTNIKVCPRCQAYIMKMDDGSCNHMTCAICGSEFCWLCMKEISDLHYLSPSGCTFWGKKPWSRKKKILWQLGTLVGAPVGIALIASIAVPAIVIGVPIFVGRKIYTKYKKTKSINRNSLIVVGVLTSVILSPMMAFIAVTVGVPILLAYVYGVVPFSLCRNGLCTSVNTTTSTPLPTSQTSNTSDTNKSPDNNANDNIDNVINPLALNYQNNLESEYTAQDLNKNSTLEVLIENCAAKDVDNENLVGNAIPSNVSILKPHQVNSHTLLAKGGRTRSDGDTTTAGKPGKSMTKSEKNFISLFFRQQRKSASQPPISKNAKHASYPLLSKYQVLYENHPVDYVDHHSESSAGAQNEALATPNVLETKNLNVDNLMNQDGNTSDTLIEKSYPYLQENSVDEPGPSTSYAPFPNIYATKEEDYLQQNSSDSQPHVTLNNGTNISSDVIIFNTPAVFCSPPSDILINDYTNCPATTISDSNFSWLKSKKFDSFPINVTTNCTTPADNSMSHNLHPNNLITTWINRIMNSYAPFLNNTASNIPYNNNVTNNSHTTKSNVNNIFSSNNKYNFPKSYNKRKNSLKTKQAPTYFEDHDNLYVAPDRNTEVSSSKRRLLNDKGQVNKSKLNVKFTNDHEPTKLSTKNSNKFFNRFKYLTPFSNSNKPSQSTLTPSQESPLNQPLLSTSSNAASISTDAPVLANSIQPEEFTQPCGESHTGLSFIGATSYGNKDASSIISIGTFSEKSIPQIHQYHHQPSSCSHHHHHQDHFHGDTTEPRFHGTATDSKVALNTETFKNHSDLGIMHGSVTNSAVILPDLSTKNQANVDSMFPGSSLCDSRLHLAAPAGASLYETASSNCLAALSLLTTTTEGCGQGESCSNTSLLTSNTNDYEIHPQFTTITSACNKDLSTDKTIDSVTNPLFGCGAAESVLHNVPTTIKSIPHTDTSLEAVKSPEALTAPRVVALPSLMGTCSNKRLQSFDDIIASLPPITGAHSKTLIHSTQQDISPVGFQNESTVNDTNTCCFKTTPPLQPLPGVNTGLSNNMSDALSQSSVSPKGVNATTVSLKSQEAPFIAPRNVYAQQHETEDECSSLRSGKSSSLLTALTDDGASSTRAMAGSIAFNHELDEASIKALAGSVINAPIFECGDGTSSVQSLKKKRKMPTFIKIHHNTTDLLGKEIALLEENPNNEKKLSNVNQPSDNINDGKNNTLTPQNSNLATSNLFGLCDKLDYHNKVVKTHFKNFDKKPYLPGVGMLNKQ